MREVEQVAEQVESFTFGPQQDLRPKSEMTRFQESPGDFFGSTVLSVCQVALGVVLLTPVMIGVLVISFKILDAIMR